MSDETIKYGFPKISKNGKRIGFKTYTMAVYNPDGSTLEDRLNEMDSSETILENRLNEVASSETILEDRLDEMDSSKTILENRLNEVASSETMLKNRLDEMDSSKTILENRLNDMDSSKTILENRLNEIASSETILENRLNDMDSSKTILENRLNDMDSSKTILENRLNEIASSETILENRLNEMASSKTYTTAVYNPDGSTLENRLNILKLNTSIGVNILDVRFDAQGNISNTGAYTIDNRGESDCTAKLQKIINNYVHIYIPTGQYKISELKLISGSTIEAKDPFNVVFKPNGNTSHLFTIENKSNIIIKNINISGNNNVANGDAINIAGNCDNILIENVHIQHFIGDSIKIHTTGTNRVSNININNVEIFINGNALYERANNINNSVFATGINISISDFRSVINISGLTCRLLQYEGSASSSSEFYTYLSHFYNNNTDTVITNNNNICLLPIIRAVSSVYNNAAPYGDNIPCINISNSIFEGMSQSIYNKGIKLNISNSVFNAGILGDIFADTGSRIQLVGASIMLLLKAVNNTLLVYYLRRKVLGQLYGINIYSEDGQVNTDLQPWGYIDVFDISTETVIYRHAYIYSLIIDEIRYFTTEEYSGTVFSSYHLIGPASPRLYHGNITSS